MNEKEFENVLFLSDREHEVLDLLGEGLTTGEIAGKLSLSSKTIETHTAHVKSKLECADICKLRALAVRYRIFRMQGAVKRVPADSQPRAQFKFEKVYA